jgi:hypothetical protein
MIRFALWGSAFIFLTLQVIDKAMTGQPPSWWTVCVAFCAGCGVLQIVHVLYEERNTEERKNHEDQPDRASGGNH